MSDKALIEAAIAVVDGWSKQRFDSRSALMCQCIDALHRAAIAAAQAEQSASVPPKELGDSIPWVLRPTGRTIPDLTNREHVCEWQRGIIPASASAPTVRPPVHSYTENGQALYTGESVAMLIANALKASASATSVQELTFNAFRQANVARCIKWHPDGIESWSPSDWLTAVTGELGELASLLKMRNRERDGLPGNKFTPTDKMVADELADVMTYLDLLAAVLGVNLGTAAVSKFNEVSERVGFPDRIALASAPMRESARAEGFADGIEAAYQKGLKAAAPKDSNGDTDLSRCTREQLIELIRECQRALLDANEKLMVRAGEPPTVTEEMVTPEGDAMTERKWHSGPPPSIGWWPASIARNENSLRWWNGGFWSPAVWPEGNAEAAARLAQINSGQSSFVEWTERPDSWPERSKT